MSTQHQSATMSVEQAGTLLGISRRSAYRAASAGHLPTIRLGRRLLVPTYKLYALLGIPTDLTGNGDHSDDTEDEAPGDGNGEENGGRTQGVSDDR